MGSSVSQPTPSYNEKQAPVPVETASKLLARLQINDAAEQTGVLSIDKLGEWEAAIDQDPAKRLARTVLTKQHIWTALVDREAVTADQQVFNLKVRCCRFISYSAIAYPNPAHTLNWQGVQSDVFWSLLGTSLSLPTLLYLTELCC